MSMDKRWQETFTRLEDVEKALKDLQGGAVETPVVTITKEQLMSIKGVGSSTADAILEMLNA